jgi:enterochelin esterase-like enzyme
MNIRSTSKNILLITLVFHPFLLFSQSYIETRKSIRGSVYQSISFYSKIAKDSLHYSIYLPPDYDISPERFPVFYLLHGLGGDETSWINDFSVHRMADSLIVEGEIPPMIIVMPDGRRSYYINDYLDVFPYDSIFIHEFLPFIDSVYKTAEDRNLRVIGGLSMGGFGALIHCFRHPGIFSAAIALSAAVRTDSMIFNEKPEKYSQNFSPIFGDSIPTYKQLTVHWKANNPLYLMNKQSAILQTICWYLDCGLSDYLLPGNEALHDLFLRYKIPHEFLVRSGGHERAYWESGLVPALQYAGKVLIKYQYSK